MTPSTSSLRLFSGSASYSSGVRTRPMGSRVGVNVIVIRLLLPTVPVPSTIRPRLSFHSLRQGRRPGRPVPVTNRSPSDRLLRLIAAQPLADHLGHPVAHGHAV